MVNHFRLPLPSSFRFQLLQPLSTLLLLLLFSSFTTVHAGTNVTVDDGDSRIVYFPPGAWTRSAQTSLDYGGSHTFTQNPEATATFNFTGVAVYFLSPLWPYTVTTAISLDSSPPVLLDLVEDTGPGLENAASRVVWSATGLDNTEHTLQISVGAGQTFAIVDGLIYTNSSASITSTSQKSHVVAFTFLENRSVSSSSSSSSNRTPLIVGALFGIISIVIFLAAFWYCLQRRRRSVSQPWPINGQTHDGTVIPNPGYVNGTDPGYGYGYPAPPSAYGYPPPAGWAPQYPQYAYFNGGPAMSPPGLSAYPGIPPNRAPNRYQPGFTLSTITEKSTPQMNDARTIPGTPMSAAAAALGANSPASLQTESGYYTAPGSSVGNYSPAVGNGQLYTPESQPQPLQRTGKS